VQTIKTFAAVLMSAIIFAPAAAAQEFRSIDGMGNNLSDLDWGAAGIQLRRQMAEDYADDVSAMVVRENPRVISNVVAAQTEDIFAPGGESDYIWQWGQFVDHDIDLTPTISESANIPIPPDDEFFPTGSGMGMGMGGGNFIPFNRSMYDTTTGTDTANLIPHNLVPHLFA